MCLSECEILAPNEGLTLKESIDISKGRFVSDQSVIDEECGCETCKEGYTRSYLHYLLKRKECLAGT